MELKNKIRIFALENAIKFKGKCNPGAVVGKVLSSDPTLKQQMKEVKPLIDEVVKEINSMAFEDQEREFQELDTGSVIEKKEKKDNTELKELRNVNGHVTMRFAPSPSGPMHVGHAMTGSLSYLYVKKYGGKLILRIEDTNSDNIYTPAYDMLPEDAKWLWPDVDIEIMIQSDRLDYYHEQCVKAIENGDVYICTCSGEKFKELKDNKEPCPCRGLSVEDNMDRWNKMFDKENGFKEGEAAARFKTDIEHKNPAMRDFPVFRINDSKHPRQGLKHRVWPLMNWSVAMDDMASGMTHTIRAKDHHDNSLKQEYIYKSFNHQPPINEFVGRINFEGLEISCSKTKKKIEDGLFSGWDDIRVPFLVAFRKRGYQAESFVKFSKAVGISKNDKTVSGEDFFKTVDSNNKEILEEKTDRYFFVRNPKEITIEDFEGKEVELDLHPEFRKGGRYIKLGQTFYIDSEDEVCEDEVVRFIDVINTRGTKYMSETYEDFKSLDGKKILHYVPKESNVKATLLMPDNTLIEGLGEENLEQISVGDVIQFERIGYARLDSVDENGMHFYFLH